MSRPVMLGLVVLGLVAGGCGGTSPRDQVDAYVKAANAVQESSAGAFAQANRDYSGFLKQRLSGRRAVERLRAAETSIRRTADRLARIPAPSVARGLRRKLLRVYRLDAGLAHETLLLARYAPARQRALQAVERANRRLAGTLRGATQPAQQAAALAQYGKRLNRAIMALRRLEPPPVAVAINRQQLERLAASRRLAGALRAAVLARDPARTARLVVAFRQLRKVRAGERALEAQALSAYAARRRAVAHALGEVRRERARLDRL